MVRAAFAAMELAWEREEDGWVAFSLRAGH